MIADIIKAQQRQAYRAALEEALRLIEKQLCPAPMYPTWDEDAAYATGYSAALSHAAEAVRVHMLLKEEWNKSDA
jgi:hypothetical protein